MRVGVRGTRMAADAGGGHTFEREILDELFRIAGESPHRFVALAGLRPTRGADPGQVELRDVAPLSRRVMQRLSRASPDDELRRDDIDLVWNLTPSHPPSDLPFLTIVWDLQHRLQPFFPEVSAGGEWERPRSL